MFPYTLQNNFTLWFLDFQWPSLYSQFCICTFCGNRWKIPLWIKRYGQKKGIHLAKFRGKSPITKFNDFSTFHDSFIFQDFQPVWDPCCNVPRNQIGYVLMLHLLFLFLSFLICFIVYYKLVITVIALGRCRCHAYNYSICGAKHDSYPLENGWRRRESPRISAW